MQCTHTHSAHSAHSAHTQHIHIAHAHSTYTHSLHAESADTAYMESGLDIHNTINYTINLIYHRHLVTTPLHRNNSLLRTH